MRHTARKYAAFAWTLLLPAGLLAQTASISAVNPRGATAAHTDRPRALATRVSAAIKIDGKLDDAAWASAAPITEFTQVDPEEGKPASERTEVRIVYDNDAIYIGAKLYDRQKVTTRLGRRDMDRGDCDWFAAIFDSYHDHQSSYVFLLNPSGVQRDAARSENNADPSWDAVWESSAHVDEDGWTAELRIPFSQLRFSGQPEQTWGVQLERDITRRGEFAVYSFTPKSEQSGIHTYGHLAGLNGVTAGKRLEVLPYVVAKNERVDPGANPFRTDSEGSMSSGVDLKYRVTSNLTLDATVNPDFGQVEVDPAVVNLSALETFYQEKRPFFLEGADIFGFGVGAVGPGSIYSNLFYSRRIGRRPQLGAPSPLADVPEAASILGAAKLSGRPGSGWSLGVLEALTQKETAHYRSLATGVDDDAIAEPLTNYFVGRALKQSASGSTKFGGIVSAVNRNTDDARVERFLRGKAFTGGVDWSHEWSRRTWRFSGFVTGSNVTGSTNAIAVTQRSPLRYYQQPDAEHLELDPNATSLSGFAAQTQIYKQSGLHWLGDFALYAVSPGYEVNDLGFQSRADQLGLNGRLVYQENRPGKLFRNYNVSTVIGYNTNFDWLPIGNTIDFGTGLTFKGFESVYLNVSNSFGTNDDRLTRGGPLSRTTTRHSVSVNYNSNYRKNTSYSANAMLMSWQSGGWYRNYGASLTLKPAPSWNVSIGPEFSKVFDPGQYLAAIPDTLATATYGNRYIFADLHQTTLSLNTRLNVTFSPNLSLQLFAQPFLSSAEFGEPKEFKQPRTFTFNDYNQVGTMTLAGSTYHIDPDGSAPAKSFEIEKPDFNLRSLRGNAVLRWQWRPGSTVYFAWQQTREDIAATGEFNFSRDRRELFRAQPDNIFLVKLSYWLNP